MDKFLEFLGLNSEGSLKRAIATGCAVVIPLVNKQFHLELSDTAVASVLGVLAVFIMQSGHKQALVEAAKAGQDASDKVTTAEDAAKVLGGEVVSGQK